MWNPVGSKLFGGLPPLQAYAKHLLEAGSGGLLFRKEGGYGRGMQILDSGDCESPETVGACDRTYLHRGWDNNRLNSLTIILALTNDVMGYMARDDKGELEEKIVTMAPGEMHISPTSGTTLVAAIQTTTTQLRGCEVKPNHLYADGYFATWIGIRQ